MRNPPPWLMVTARLPATVPANVTSPPATAFTGVPTGTAKSVPQCPGTFGSKPRITGPSTGAASTRQRASHTTA